jgi:hypothetical protein
LSINFINVYYGIPSGSRFPVRRRVMVNEQDAIVVLEEGVDESQESHAACCKGPVARAVV